MEILKSILVEKLNLAKSEIKLKKISETIEITKKEFNCLDPPKDKKISGKFTYFDSLMNKK